MRADRGRKITLEHARPGEVGGREEANQCIYVYCLICSVMTMVVYPAPSLDTTKVLLA